MTRPTALSRWLIAAGLVLALAACSDPPERGYVTEKHHHAAWIQMVCSAYNKGVCTVWVPITHPERWELCLRNGDDEGCRGVDEATYGRYEVGQRYP